MTVQSHRVALIWLGLVLAVSRPALAIETIVGVADRIVDGTAVEIEGRIVRLWGCEPAQSGVVEATAAAAALAELVGTQPLICIQVDQSPGQMIARCFVQQVDLCSAMVQTGHAADTLGAYAEEQAAARRTKGVWQ